MVDTSTVLPIMQTILAFANICIIGYGLYKFLSNPHSSLEKRVEKLEDDVEEIKNSMGFHDGRFDEQDKTNEVLIRSVFALLEFEVHYCETEQKPISKNLEKAKDDLHEYLAKPRNGIK